MNNKIISFLYILSACAMLAIGRFHDDRLTILNIDFSFFISATYTVTSLLIIFSFRKIFLSKSRNTLFLFYFLVIITTPILWGIYGVTDFQEGKFGGSIANYINFLLIVIPTSIIIMQKFEYENVKLLIKILFSVSLFLAITSLFFISELNNGRLVVLGGGPIVFCRWMQFGILILLFYPKKKKNVLNYILIVGFLILSLATGSRGPLIALILTGSVYMFLNLKHSVIRLIPLIFLLLAIALFTGIDKKVSKLGNTQRVFMNISEKGFKNKSIETRFDLIERSLEMMYHHPFGVGSGNWQLEANKINPKHLMNGNLFYPHNLFLEVANEYGVYTGIILIILFIRVIYFSYRKLIRFKDDKSSLYPLLFYTMFFFIANTLLSGSLIDSRLLFIILSILLIKEPLIETKNR